MYGGNVVSQNAYNQNPSGYGIHLNNNQVLDGKSTQSGTLTPANLLTRDKVNVKVKTPN